MLRYTFDWQDDMGYSEVETENRSRISKKESPAEPMIRNQEK